MAEIFGVNETYANNAEIENLESERQTLIGVYLDESGSMYHHEDVVRDCLRDFQNSIKGSKECDEILVSLTTFGSSVTPGGYQQIDDMNTSYRANGCTKLYDCIVDGQKRLIDGNGGGYMEVLRANGIKVQARIAIYSDGEDTASRHSLNDARRAIEFLHKNEVMVSFIGFGPMAHGIAEKLGIYKQNIREPQDLSPTELRKEFMLLPKSAISASKSVGATNVETDSFFVV